jgi:hypothetical protein
MPDRSGLTTSIIVVDRRPPAADPDDGHKVAVPSATGTRTVHFKNTSNLEDFQWPLNLHTGA